MERTLRFGAVFEKHGNWYVGYVPEVPGVNSQERTLKEARKSLATALQELAELNTATLLGNKRQFEEMEVVIGG